MKKQILIVVSVILSTFILLLGCSNNEQNSKSIGAMDREAIKIGRYFGEPYKVTSSFMPILTIKNGNAFNLELGIDKSMGGTYRIDNNKMVLTSSDGDESYMFEIANKTLVIEQEIPKYLKKGTNFKLNE